MNTDQIPICLCCKYPLDDESIEAGEHSMCQNVCPDCNVYLTEGCDPKICDALNAKAQAEYEAEKERRLARRSNDKVSYHADNAGGAHGKDTNGK